VIRTVEPSAIALGDRQPEAEVTMVSTLLARAHESDTIVGPVSWLFQRQADAARAMAEAAATLARPVVDALGPGPLIGMAVLVAVPVLATLLAAVTGTAKALAA
jgi:hypothetical protein